MRWISLAAIGAFLGAIDGRAFADGSASPFRVVILGSSTAAGEAARPLDSSWVNKYTRYLGTVLGSYEVVNLAVGGYTTFNIMPTGTSPSSPYNLSKYQPVVTNNITHALALGPSLIIINMPTNDCADYIPVSQQLANYGRILQDADNAGVPVWITTTQPRNLDTAGRTLLMSMRDATWSNFPSRTIDFWTGLAASNGTILAQYDYDGTHLNNAGHEVLFERVVNRVQLVLPLQPSPNSITFADLRVGASGSQTLTLNNNTAGSITVASIAAGTSVFSADKSNAVVGAGSSLTINVSFSPGAIGSFVDTLVVNNNSASPVLTIPLQGNSPLATVQSSLTSISFGDVALQTTKNVTLTLSTSSLNNATVSSSSFNGAGFSINPGTGTVTPSTPLSMVVSFTPTRYGGFVDTLKIRGVFSNGVLAIPITGNSPVPVLNTNPSTMDFGDVNLNVSKSLPLVLGNASMNTISVDAIVTTKAEFYVSPSSGSVPASGNWTVNVQFMPTTFGVVRDTIQIFTSASGTPVRVPIMGNSPAPTLSLSRTQITFPEIGRGDAVTRPMTIYNLGSSAISVQSFTTKTKNFSVPRATPVTVNALDSLTIDVRFGPDTTGDLKDTLTITTNAGAKTVALAGTAPASILTASFPKVNFGTYKTGTLGYRTTVLHVNTTDGGVTVRVDSIRLYHSGFSAWGLTNPVTLSRTDSVVLQVEFHPSQFITYKDTLHIFNNTALPVIHVPLEGVGGTSTDVEATPLALPVQTALLQNYPNPFNPTTKIGYNFGESGNRQQAVGSSAVKLVVFDLLGREVAVLVDGIMEPGRYEVEFNAAGLASGMYVYRLSVGTDVVSKKMMLTR
jgi:lysophospholipase L1-like esterase